jgi:hypothetical protein
VLCVGLAMRAEPDRGTLGINVFNELFGVVAMPRGRRNGLLGTMQKQVTCYYIAIVFAILPKSVAPHQL